MDDDVSTSGLFDNNHHLLPSGISGPIHQETPRYVEPNPEEIEQRRIARKAEQELNPNYLKGKKKVPKETCVDNIPVAQIDLSIPLHIPGISSSDKYLQSHLSTVNSQPVI